MPRRIIEDEPSHHERWVVSYADFITLLFAFFVVMYSISSVHEGKYRMLSKTLEEVFVDSVPNDSQSAVVAGGHIDSAIEFPMPGNYNALEDRQYGIEGDKKNIEAGGAEGVHDELPFEPRLEAMKEQVAAQFNDLVERGELSVTGNRNWIAIDINSNFLFASGEAEPSEMAEVIIKGVAEILIRYTDPIQVEGFTDNIPIHTAAFPSNWELSSARAAAIVRLLAYNRIDPARMSAVGYGEYHPIVSNATEAGRSKNRHVSIVLSRSGTVRHSSLDQPKDKQALLEALQLDLMEEALLKQGIDAIESSDEEGAESEGLEELGAPPKERQEAAEGVKTIPLGRGGLLFTN